MMRRLFWPLLGLLLLEGFFLNLSLGWMVAASAIALFGYLACEAIRAHRALADIIARMNAEIAARAEQADTGSQLAAIGAHRDFNAVEPNGAAGVCHQSVGGRFHPETIVRLATSPARTRQLTSWARTERTNKL